tara:strand:- start:25374 stop:26192 length:819 start_codon:yes stop_codon:yes gene_type:complete
MAFLDADEKKQMLVGANNKRLRWMHAAGQTVLDLLLPPKCLKCSGRVDQAHSLCPDCWKGLHFITDPKCKCCGYPFEINLGNDYSALGEQLCGACQKIERSFDKAVSALRYDDDSRQMVIGFKHQDKVEYAAYFVKLLSQAGATMLCDVDIIVPVPLHKMRLLSRRYNQSALLSRLFAREHGIVHTAELLERTKNTPPQQGNLSKRFKNVRGVFKVGPKHKDTIKNKTILLIDDVYTTGSTTENCARCLKKAGAAKVYVLTVFRVISPQNPK